MESAHYIATGNLTFLSTQYLIDCDFLDAGCSGGNPQNGKRFFFSVISKFFTIHALIPLSLLLKHLGLHLFLACPLNQDILISARA
jgi:hypothetical protein